MSAGAPPELTLEHEMKLPKWARSRGLKLAISLVLLIIAFESAGWSSVREALSRTSPFLLLVATVGYSISQLINTSKWRLLMRNSGMRVDMLRAVRATFVGMYLNCFGLGTIGGDVVRALLVSDHKSSHPVSLAIVVLDRLLGLSVLAAVGAVASLLVQAPVPPVLEYVSLTLVAGAAVTVLLAAALPKLLASRLPEKITKLISLIPSRPSVLIPIVAVSATFHVFQISLWWLIAALAGFTPSFSSLLAVIPFVNIAATLPLSWMGVGIRESTLLVLAVPYVFDRDEAIVASLLWTGGLIVSSTLGAIFYSAKGSADPDR